MCGGGGGGGGGEGVGWTCKDKTIIFLCAKYIDFQKYIIFYGHFTATL